MKTNQPFREIPSEGGASQPTLQERIEKDAEGLAQMVYPSEPEKAALFKQGTIVELTALIEQACLDQRVICADKAKTKILKHRVSGVVDKETIKNSPSPLKQ